MKFHRSPIGLLPCALFLVLPAAALAETPEEAVAYAFLGLAAGAELDRGPMHLTWRAASSSPAMFVGHGEGAGVSYDVTFTVTALSDCAYEVQLAGPPGMVPGGKALYARIDLDRITGVEAGEFHVTVEGDGYCQTGERNPTCTVVRRVDLFGTLESAKHARLVDALHRDVCVRPDQARSIGAPAAISAISTAPSALRRRQGPRRPLRCRRR